MNQTAATHAGIYPPRHVSNSKPPPAANPDVWQILGRPQSRAEAEGGLVSPIGASKPAHAGPPDRGPGRLKGSGTPPGQNWSHRIRPRREPKFQWETAGRIRHRSPARTPPQEIRYPG